eukprot:gene2392-4643_t
MQGDLVKSIVSCSLLALQFGLQPLVSSRFTNKSVARSSIVFATELEKIIIAIVAISCGPSAVREKIIEGWSVSSSIQMAALPAILYTIQNVMTIWAAVWLFIILKQKQSYMQMFALTLLLLAAVILNTEFSTAMSTTNITERGENYNLGVLLVLGASATSGLSAALTQRALVAAKPRETVFFSAELAVYSLVLLVGKEVFFGKGFSPSVFFMSWDLWTLIPVTCNISLCSHDNDIRSRSRGVRKGFALIAGILVTAFAQWMVEGKPLRLQDWVALCLVSVSIYLHSTFPIPKTQTKTQTQTKPTQTQTKTQTKTVQAKQDAKTKTDGTKKNK